MAGVPGPSASGAALNQRRHWPTRTATVAAPTVPGAGGAAPGTITTTAPHRRGVNFRPAGAELCADGKTSSSGHAADVVRVFVGNGTADHPDAGLLLGNGYSWTAYGGVHQRPLPRWPGGSDRQQRQRFPWRQRWQAGWFGNSGDGGDATNAPGGGGSHNGNGGLITGSGGNGGRERRCSRSEGRRDRRGSGGDGSAGAWWCSAPAAAAPGGRSLTGGSGGRGGATGAYSGYKLIFFKARFREAGGGFGGGQVGSAGWGSGDVWSLLIGVGVVRRRPAGRERRGVAGQGSSGGRGGGERVSWWATAAPAGPAGARTAGGSGGTGGTTERRAAVADRQRKAAQVGQADPAAPEQQVRPVPGGTSGDSGTGGVGGEGSRLLGRSGAGGTAATGDRAARAAPGPPAAQAVPAAAEVTAGTAGFCWCSPCPGAGGTGRRRQFRRRSRWRNQRQRATIRQRGHFRVHQGIRRGRWGGQLRGSPPRSSRCSPRRLPIPSPPLGIRAAISGSASPTADDAVRHPGQRSARVGHPDPDRRGRRRARSVTVTVDSAGRVWFGQTGGKEGGAHRRRSLRHAYRRCVHRAGGQSGLADRRSQRQPVWFGSFDPEPPLIVRGQWRPGRYADDHPSFDAVCSNPVTAVADGNGNPVVRELRRRRRGSVVRVSGDLAGTPTITTFDTGVIKPDFPSSTTRRTTVVVRQRLSFDDPGADRRGPRRHPDHHGIRHQGSPTSAPAPVDHNGSRMVPATRPRAAASCASAAT